MHHHRTTLGRPIAYATIFHLLLLCLFVLVRMDTAPQKKEYFEVSLAQSPPKGSNDFHDERERLRKQQMAGTQANSSSKVTLPSRRMFMDSDEITVPSYDEKIADASSGDIGEKISQADYSREEQDWSPSGSNVSSGKRGVTQYENSESSNNHVFELGSNQGTTKNAFRLEWVTGGDRKLLKQTMPHYPAGVDQETIIKLKFKVMPNGSIEGIIPLRKGNPRLEEITLKAFSSWRFEPLSPSAEQTPQEGFITFIFKLT